MTPEELNEHLDNVNVPPWFSAMFDQLNAELNAHADRMLALLHPELDKAVHGGDPALENAYRVGVSMGLIGCLQVDMTSRLIDTTVEKAGEKAGPQQRGDGDG